MEENNKNSIMPMIVGAIVILALAGGAYYFTQMRSPEASIEDNTSDSMMEATDEPEAMMEEENQDEAMMEDGEAMMEEEASVTFEISGTNFEFSETELTVNEGDTVKIVFTSEEGTHDWMLDEFDAQTEIVNQGETTEVTFVVDSAGEYEFYCSVGSHREMGMVGTLIVE